MIVIKAVVSFSTLPLTLMLTFLLEKLELQSIFTDVKNLSQSGKICTGFKRGNDPTLIIGGCKHLPVLIKMGDRTRTTNRPEE